MHNEVIIQGGFPLRGRIQVSGSKNAAVAVIPAAVLSRSVVELYNVPDIQDIRDMLTILSYLNVGIERQGTALRIDARHITNRPLLMEEVQRLRASYYLMGVLLALFNEVDIIGPGGCRIGSRPIDLHRFAFEKMGYVVEEENYHYHVRGSPHQSTVVFSKVSVGATINAILAGSCSEEIIVLEGVAKEPEIDDVIRLINGMGGFVRSVGTTTLLVGGRRPNRACQLEIIPDRIEAGTYALMGSLLAESLEIKPIIPLHMEAVLRVLKKMGVPFEIKGDSLLVTKSMHVFPVEVTTAPYPGFPTDLQQPLTTVLTQAQGESRIEDTIFTQRHAHVAELRKMGALISFEDTTLVIHGPQMLKGTEVSGQDLRGGASLILAAMIASGESHIAGLRHVHRGYNGIVEKINQIGGHLTLVEDKQHGNMDS